MLPDGAAVIAADDVDAVLVTSRGPSHAEHVLHAIAAGKPVESGGIGEPLIVHCAHRNAVHEVDVLRWLLDDEIVSAQVITPRATGKRFAHLKDPQIMLFETAMGVRVDLEVFVNCQYGYDIQCETVGEEGLVRLPDPAAVAVRTAARHSTAVLTDRVGRFRWRNSSPASSGRASPSTWRRTRTTSARRTPPRSTLGRALRHLRMGGAGTRVLGVHADAGPVPKLEQQAHDP